MRENSNGSPFMRISQMFSPFHWLPKGIRKGAGLFGLALMILPGPLPSPLQADSPSKPSIRAPFDSATPLKVHIELSPAEYDAIQPKSAPPQIPGLAFFQPKPKEDPGKPPREVHKNTFGMNLPWGKGSVIVDGQSFKNVGIRYKGNGTIADSSESIKKSFKIDLDQFGETRKYKTLKTLNLHCEVADPSKIREIFGYGIYASAGIPAPKTRFAEVTLTVGDRIKNQWLGLYTLVEPVDKVFLKNHFGNGEGLLMKPEGIRDFPKSGQFKDYVTRLEPKRTANPGEINRIFAVGKLVAEGSDDEFRAKIGSFIDLDNYLRFLAITAYISNPDCFFVLSHNYYLYLDAKTQKLHFFPWDLDRAFANLFFLGTNNQQMDLSFIRPYGPEHKLTERILAMPGMRDRYLGLLKNCSQTTLAPDRLKAELARIRQTAGDLIERDRKATTDRKEKKNPGPGFMVPPPDLDLFVAKRSISLGHQLAGRSEGHLLPADFQIGSMLVSPVMTAFDLNKDETLSRSEWTDGAKKVWENTPEKSKGPVDAKQLTKGFESLFPKPPKGDKSPGGFFTPFAAPEPLANASVRRFDTNKDGKLTQEEWNKGIESLFNAVKTIDPQKLTETELAKMLVPFLKIPPTEPSKP